MINNIKEYKNSNLNKLALQDRPIHNWYRFVLSFPPHLVQDYIKKFHLNNQTVLLDPFCGTGTTLVEAELNGIPSVGLEANPIAYLASKVKTNLSVDPNVLRQESKEVAKAARKLIGRQGINDDFVYGGDLSQLQLLDLTPRERLKWVTQNRKIKLLIIKSTRRSMLLHF
jgi:DNA methylase